MAEHRDVGPAGGHAGRPEPQRLCRRRQRRQEGHGPAQRRQEEDPQGPRGERRQCGPENLAEVRKIKSRNKKLGKLV